MTLSSTPIGRNPAAIVERFDDGRVLVVVLNSTGSHYCILMQIYEPDLTNPKTVLSMKYPLGEKAS